MQAGGDGKGVFATMAADVIQGSEDGLRACLSTTGRSEQSELPRLEVMSIQGGLLLGTRGNGT